MVEHFAKYASVLLEEGLKKPLDYGIPDALIDKVQQGMRVKVPVRGHLRSAYICALKESSDFPRVSPIAEILHEESSLPPDLFELGKWIAKYYSTSLSRVLSSMLPGGVRKGVKSRVQFWVKRKKSIEELIEECKKVRQKAPAQGRILEEMLQVKKEILLTELLEKTGAARSSVEQLVKKELLLLSEAQTDGALLRQQDYFRTKAKILNHEQLESLQQINSAIDEKKFAPFLLYGITGSGKTEIYLQAIEHALTLERSTIMLVPEISLTEQTIERFRSRFEQHVALLHHRLSDGERAKEWQRIYEGKVKIVIGARSAIFSPVKDLGLIIVDEEHEQSYKQSDSSPCYNARDVAVLRAAITKSTVVLGSATPSLESYYNAQSGKYTLLELTSRADAALLPSVSIVDMNHEYDKAKGPTQFSDLLLREIEKRFRIGEQTLLFLNRRGYHTSQMCPQCRSISKCPECDIALTFHRGENILSCHLCNYSLAPPPKHCLSCNSDLPLKFHGAGTEQIERALHAIFPEIRTLRMDADTTKHKGSHDKLLRQFRSGKADILIGTQMIAKGLHFPQVTLVGVINCDATLNIPDFRASEKAFQLLTQVAGRAGRGALAGSVIIQTLMPDNSTILLASKQDFKEFYKQEIDTRKLFHYPPYTHLIKLIFTGPSAESTERAAQQLCEPLRKRLAPPFECLPVVPAGHPRIKNKYRFQALLRGPSIYFLHEQIQAARSMTPLPKEITFSIDVDPLSTFF